MSLFPLLGLLVWTAQETVAPVPLETGVIEFWSLLQKQDKASALRFVHPDDLNNFIRRNEGSLLNWRLKGIEYKSEDEALVTVTFERLLLNSKLPQDLVETWVRQDDSWRVRIAKPVPVVERVRERAREIALRNRPETLEVYPRQLRFYALSPAQPAAISIRNGLPSEVRVEQLDFDADRIKVLSGVDSVPPRGDARILVGYVGGVEELNQTSTVRLRISMDGEIRDFEIPVIINYSDEVTRWATGKRKPRD